MVNKITNKEKNWNIVIWILMRVMNGEKSMVNDEGRKASGFLKINKRNHYVISTLIIH